MDRVQPPAHPAPDFTRRRLVQFGAAGAATLWLGGFGRLGGIASAATGPAHLRRLTYLLLAPATLDASVNGVAHKLEIIAVEDLPVAAYVASLRNRDDAFLLRLRGAPGSAIGQGKVSMSHPQLGRFELFLVPDRFDAEMQEYNVVVDRSVGAPKLDEDGSPAPVDPPLRRGEARVRHRRKRRHRGQRHRPRR